MSTVERPVRRTLTFVPRRPPRLVLCLPPLAPAAVRRALAAGAVAVDGRSPEAHDGGHIPGSLCLPLDGDAFEERARSVIAAGARIVAVADGDVDGQALARALARAGFRSVLGVLGGGVSAWVGAGYDVECQPAATAERLLEDLQLGGAVLVDARDDAEWLEGHVPGSVHLPLESLTRQTCHLPRTPVVVACGDGLRAATAASVLRRGGHREVWRVAGGGLEYLLGRRLDLRGV